MPSLKSNLLPASLQSVPSLLRLLQLLSWISCNHPRFEPCPAISPYQAQSHARSVKHSFQQQLSPHVLIIPSCCWRWSSQSATCAAPATCCLSCKALPPLAHPSGWEGNKKPLRQLVVSRQCKKKTCLKFPPTICKNLFVAWSPNDATWQIIVAQPIVTQAAAAAAVVFLALLLCDSICFIQQC